MGLIEIYATANTEEETILPFEFCCVLSIASHLYAIWIVDVPSLLQFMKEIDASQFDSRNERMGTMNSLAGQSAPDWLAQLPHVAAPPPISQTEPLPEKLASIYAAMRHQQDAHPDQDEQDTPDTQDTQDIPANLPKQTAASISQPLAYERSPAQPLEAVIEQPSLPEQATARISPAVAAEKIPDLLFIGATNGIVRALQADNGISRWEYTLANTIASLYYWQQIIFIATRTDNQEKQQQFAYVYALQAQDGSLLWSTRIDGASTISSLVCERDIVCITTNLNKSTVFGLNAFNGSLQWKATATSWVTAITLKQILAAQDGIVYLTSSSTGIEALNIEDGKVLWKISELTAARQLALTPGKIYVHHQITTQVDGVMIIDREHNTIQKRQSYPQQFKILQVTTQGIAYAVRDEQRLYAYSVEDNNLLWNVPIPPLETDTQTSKVVPSNLLSPLLLNDLLCYYRLLLFQATHNVSIEVTAHSLQDGQQKWRQQIPLSKPPAWNACNLTGKRGLLYLTTPQGMYVIQLANGALLGQAFQDNDFSAIAPVLPT